MSSYQERSSRPYRWLLTLAVLAALALFARPIAHAGIRVANFVRAPKQVTVTPLVLQRWLSDADPSHPLLLDARGRAETRVSMIPGARRVDPDDPNPAATLGIRPGTAVVVYSAVGWRAVPVVERLTAAGIEPAMNLRGGIFRWAAEGRPLETPARAHTGLVHPVDPALGFLLPREHRARP